LPELIVSQIEIYAHYDDFGIIAEDKARPGDEGFQAITAENMNGRSRLIGGLQIIGGGCARGDDLMLKDAANAHAVELGNIIGGGFAAVVARQHKRQMAHAQEVEELGDSRQHLIAAPEYAVHVHDDAVDGREIHKASHCNVRAGLRPAPTVRSCPAL